MVKKHFLQKESSIFLVRVTLEVSFWAAFPVSLNNYVGFTP